MTRRRQYAALQARRGCAATGYSFIEVMVAMVILSIGLVGLAGITNVIIFQNRFSGDYIAASRLAYNRLNELMRFNTEAMLRDASSDFDCTLTGNCSSVPQGLMLATTPGIPSVDDAGSTIKIKSDNTDVTAAAELSALETSGVCNGLHNVTKLESGTTSAAYCSRIEYDLNAEGNFAPANKGGEGANAITFQPPYKFTRFYTVCRCILGASIGNSDCSATCTTFKNADTNKVIFAVRVYVDWADSQGKYHLFSTPYQGIEVEVEDTGYWD